MIHPTAIISPGAELDDSVSVGPYAVIGGQVKSAQERLLGPTPLLKVVRKSAVITRSFSLLLLERFLRI